MEFKDFVYFIKNIAWKIKFIDSEKVRKKMFQINVGMYIFFNFCSLDLKLILIFFTCVILIQGCIPVMPLVGGQGGLKL